jgi:hypothetical protein
MHPKKYLCNLGKNVSFYAPHLIYFELCGSSKILGKKSSLFNRDMISLLKIFKLIQFLGIGYSDLGRIRSKMGNYNRSIKKAI